ncbi:hypothetical protein SDC9_122819 [bioreactor metagenome]|uniref:Uncharacterized protein n=1 Tax=bioreactor metagenome TaxID=1076179 RepID=A0A645CG05_9ZZZZ
MRCTGASVAMRCCTLPSASSHSRSPAAGAASARCANGLHAACSKRPVGCTLALARTMPSTPRPSGSLARSGSSQDCTRGAAMRWGSACASTKRSHSSRPACATHTAPPASISATGRAPLLSAWLRRMRRASVSTTST